MHVSVLHSNDAQVGERTHIARTQTYTFGLSNLHTAPESATGILHRRRPHQQAMSAFSLSLFTSALAEPHSFPYLSGATPVSLAFTRQRDLQGTASCPLSTPVRRMTSTIIRRRNCDFFCFVLEGTSTLQVGFSVRWGRLRQRVRYYYHHFF